jgi:uncharacterized membrane protein
MAKNSNTNIIALGFDDLDGAENMLANVHSFQERGFFTVKDAVVVTKPVGDNKLQIKQTVKKTGKWALGGGGIGFLAGMLLGGPVGGLVVGATVGAISGALKDSGIDDNFIHTVGTSLRDDTSALFVMVEPNPNRNEDDLMKELSEHRAKVLSTTLSPEREKQLRGLLSGAGVPAAAQPTADATVVVTGEVTEVATEDGVVVPEEVTEEVVVVSTEIDAEATIESAAEPESQPMAEAATDAAPEASAETSDDDKKSA